MLIFNEAENDGYTVVQIQVGSLIQKIYSGHCGFTPLVEDILNSYKIPFERKVYTDKEFEEKF